MLSIRKYDLVTVADCDVAKVIDIISTEILMIYKLRKLTNDQIIYVDEKLVRLKRQSKKNFIMMLFTEIINFTLYSITVTAARVRI